MNPTAALPFSFLSRRALCAVAATLFGLAVSAAASAATLTVNSADDGQDPGGVCTLRGAVDAVNNGADANGCTADIGVNAYGTNDTIVFDTSVSGTILFTSGQIVISKNLILTGPGAAVLALDGGGTTRLLYVDGGTALTVAGLTLQNGNAGSGSGGAIEVGVGGHALTVRDSVFSGNKAGWGGAIDINSSSTLAVENCAFTGNTATGDGGAIWAYTATVSASTFTGNTTVYDGGAILATTATVAASTFSGNTAANGGAIWGGTTTVSASTFSGNTAANRGGAIWAAGATIDASTFLGNTADSRGGAIFAQSILTGNGLTLVNNTAPFGAAVFINGSSGTLYNSLVAGDATVTTAHCAVDTGTISGDTNLEWREGVGDETSCGSTSPVSVGGASALTAIVAGNLADNGGPTQTLALPSGSPALGTADPSSVPPPTATDQRGIARDATPDLGAFELGTLTIAGTLPNGDIGQPYNGRVSANGTYGYTYAVSPGSLPPGLTLDSATGAITGPPSTAGTYTFTITVTDALGAIASEDFTVAIMEALSLSGTLSGGDVGQTYSGSVSASGGTAPYTYTVTTGSLPPGLALNSTTGAVTGTPTTAGNYSFTITVTDALNDSVSQSFTVTILGGPPPGAAAIPALGPWALLALVGLLGGAGVMRRRG